jgi:hypothetical protein
VQWHHEFPGSDFIYHPLRFVMEYSWIRLVWYGVFGSDSFSSTVVLPVLSRKSCKRDLREVIIRPRQQILPHRYIPDTGGRTLSRIHHSVLSTAGSSQRVVHRDSIRAACRVFQSWSFSSSFSPCSFTIHMYNTQCLYTLRYNSIVDERRRNEGI